MVRRTEDTSDARLGGEGEAGVRRRGQAGGGAGKERREATKREGRTPLKYWVHRGLLAYRGSGEEARVGFEASWWMVAPGRL